MRMRMREEEEEEEEEEEGGDEDGQFLLGELFALSLNGC